MPITEVIRDEVIRIVADVAEVEPAAVSAEAELVALGVDSLGGLRIVAAVERRYGIVIGEEEISKIRTMQDVLALVEKHSPRE